MRSESVAMSSALPDSRGVNLFTAEVMVVLISASGKPMRLSTALREALQAT